MYFVQEQRLPIPLGLLVSSALQTVSTGGSGQVIMRWWVIVCLTGHQKGSMVLHWETTAKTGLRGMSGNVSGQTVQQRAQDSFRPHQVHLRVSGRAVDMETLIYAWAPANLAEMIIECYPSSSSITTNHCNKLLYWLKRNDLVINFKSWCGQNHIDPLSDFKSPCCPWVLVSYTVLSLSLEKHPDSIIYRHNNPLALLHGPHFENQGSKASAYF